MNHLALILPACAQVFILQGANMQAAAYINPNQDDYSSYANVQQSMLLRFGIAAVWCLVLGVAQVRPRRLCETVCCADRTPGNHHLCPCHARMVVFHSPRSALMMSLQPFSHKHAWDRLQQCKACINKVHA